MFFCRRIIKLDKMSGTIQGFSKELTLTVKCFFGFEETLTEELAARLSHKIQNLEE